HRAESPKETKYMSEYQDTQNQNTTGTPRWVGLAVAVLGGVSLLGLGVGFSALSRSNNLETTTQASLKQQNDALSQRLAKDDEINQQLQSDLKVVTDKLNVTQADLIAARKQNKSSVVTYDKKLTALGNDVNQKLAGKANQEDVNKLGTDVNGVRTDLDATNSTLAMAKSEMGTLIARNHDEIDQLRRMGQRDYFEFTVSRKAGAQR